MSKENNSTLKETARLDQLDRTRYFMGELSEKELWERDRVRLLKVTALHQKGKIITAQDHTNAAIVFQHGRDENDKRSSFASGMAIKMMQKAINIDKSTNKWLLAAAIDRDLMIRNLPQIYGTQYIRKDEFSPWEFYTFDGSKITDKEREEFEVTVIAKQNEALKNMNQKKILSVFLPSKDIDTVIDFCQSQINTNTDYDLSWQGISQFGFQLIRIEKLQEALKIFQLLIQLYPQEYDPYHSLGVLLLQLNRKSEAIEMFEKTLEINPNCKEAKKDLEKLR